MARVIVVVPCYNEAARFDASAFQEFARTTPDVAFVFVNDGSTDSTANALTQVCRSCPETFSSIHLPRNRGKAEAVRQGILKAVQEDDCRYVAMWDADLAAPLAEIVNLRRTFEDHPQCEIVMGSRVKLLGHSIIRPALRHYLGRFAATLISWATHLPVYDTQCGAKMFRRTEIIEGIFASPFTSSWLFDVEILFRFQAAWIARGGPVSCLDALYELPLHEWRNKMGSKIHAKDYAKALWDLAAMVVRYR